MKVMWNDQNLEKNREINPQVRGQERTLKLN